MGPGYFATLAVIFALGLLAIVAVVWTARLRDREQERELRSAPPDPIPGLRIDAPQPEYLTELELRDTPEGAVATDLDDAQRAAVEAELAQAVRVAAGYLDGDFVTDRASQWAVVDDAVVAWCPEGIGSTRELLTLLAALPRGEGSPGLVVLAPTWTGEVVDLLRVNVRRRLLRAVPVQAEPEVLGELLTATGLQPLARRDLLADYVPERALVSVRRWVSGPADSWALLG